MSPKLNQQSAKPCPTNKNVNNVNTMQQTSIPANTRKIFYRNRRTDVDVDHHCLFSLTLSRFGGDPLLCARARTRTQRPPHRPPKSQTQRCGKTEASTTSSRPRDRSRRGHRLATVRRSAAVVPCRHFSAHGNAQGGHRHTETQIHRVVGWLCRRAHTMVENLLHTHTNK